MQQFQKEILATLYELRESLISDIKNFTPSEGSRNTNADSDNAKDAKIAELEAENRKLNYRILHLSRNLREKLNQ